MWRNLKQWAALSAVSMLCTAKVLLGDGSGANPNTLLMASLRFLRGESLYAPPVPGATYYKYSPFFAFLYSPMTFLPGGMRGFLWGTLNITIFWIGITYWFQFSKKTSWWMWLAVIVCSMEVDGTVRHLQTNALLVGLILIALSIYRDRRHLESSSLMAAVTSFKIFPSLVCLPLIFGSRRFLGGLLITGLCTFLLPALVTGMSQNIQNHREWIETLVYNSKPGQFTDSFSTDPARILSLANTCKTFGLTFLGQVATLVVLLATLHFTCRAMKRGEMAWHWLVPMLLTAMVLCNPATEGATFVIASPALLFLMGDALSFPRRNRIYLAVLVLCMFLLSILYNDVWPKSLWNPRGAAHSFTKPLAALILWGCCVWRAVGRLDSRRSQ